MAKAPRRCARFGGRIELAFQLASALEFVSDPAPGPGPRPADKHWPRPRSWCAKPCTSALHQCKSPAQALHQRPAPAPVQTAPEPRTRAPHQRSHQSPDHTPESDHAQKHEVAIAPHDAPQSQSQSQTGPRPKTTPATTQASKSRRSSMSVVQEKRPPQQRLLRGRKRVSARQLERWGVKPPHNTVLATMLWGGPCPIRGRAFRQHWPAGYSIRPLELL